MSLTVHVLCDVLCAQVGCPSKSKEAPLALKALYDADVTEEDIILAWHDKEDAAKVCGSVWSVWVCLPVSGIMYSVKGPAVEGVCTV